MNIYVPTMYQKSIYTIDYSKLLSKGIKCLLFDLDNTITHPTANEFNQKTKDLFISLKQKGFTVFIFSNSPKKRVNIYKEFLNVEGSYLSLKPFTRKLKKIIIDNDFDINQVALIGDQIMTDIVCGNKIGITTILVTPISTEEHIFSKINRFFEKKKIKKLEDLNMLHIGEYYD